MLVATIVLAAGLIVFVVFLYKRSQRAREIKAVLIEHGFDDQSHDQTRKLDFTVTLQWPEGRGIRYRSCFVKFAQARAFEDHPSLALQAY